jgi:hypothetical protein
VYISSSPSIVLNLLELCHSNETESAKIDKKIFLTKVDSSSLNPQLVFAFLRCFPVILIFPAERINILESFILLEIKQKKLVLTIFEYLCTYMLLIIVKG